MWVVRADECGCPERSEDGVGFLGAGVTGNCDLPKIGPGKQILVLCKSSKSSYLLSRHVSPRFHIFSRNPFLECL